MLVAFGTILENFGDFVLISTKSSLKSSGNQAKNVGSMNIYTLGDHNLQNLKSHLLDFAPKNSFKFLFRKF